jgi:hypothetical protein
MKELDKIEAEVGEYIGHTARRAYMAEAIFIHNGRYYAPFKVLGSFCWTEIGENWRQLV